MSDLGNELVATQRDLRETRAVLNRAREEITQLRAENAELRAVAGPVTVSAVMALDGDTVRAAILRGDR